MVPLLELFSSKAGTFEFQGRNFLVPREELFDSSGGNVLFLKKVHSWGGITETVHGSFLLVLRVYSFVSFAPAGVHDLWSSLPRMYAKISLCWELSDMGSELLENCS